MNRRPLFFLVALALSWACKGLFVDQGNDFPCDFTQPPGIRDQACAPGEICGVLNRCQRFVYEGPQFEGVPTQPDASVGGKVHPLILDSPVQAVTVNAGDRSKVTVVMTGADGVERLYSVDLTTGSQVTTGDPVLTDRGFVQQLAFAGDAGLLFLFSDGGAKQVVQNGQCVYGPNQMLGQCLKDSRQIRSGIETLGMLRGDLKLPNQINTGGLVNALNAYLPFSVQDDTGDSGEPIEDLLFATRSTLFSSDPMAPGGSDVLPIVYSASGFWLPTPDGGVDWDNLLAPGETPEPGGTPNFFRRNEAARVWAVAYNFFDSSGVPTGNRLSTWLLGKQIVANPSFAFARAWSDCQPCTRASSLDGQPQSGTIVGVAPKHDGPPSVEVLCSTGGELSLVEVTGSTAAGVGQSCDSSPLPLPFDPMRLVIKPDANSDVSAPVQDVTTGYSVAVGGLHGDVWSGVNFSTALPLFLERVPLATGVLTLDGGALAEVAVTGTYIASRESNNGFKAFRIADTDGNLVLPRASIGSAPGWFVDVYGRTLLMTPRPGMSPQLLYGPVLLNAHGDPAIEPFFGEAVLDVRGQLVSFVMAANDSLYLAPFPQPTNDPALSASVSPVLSPEPNVPILSFTLERTPIGTNGIDRVRGYLVTSRDVYEFELSGTPPRWKTTLLPLSAGEPVEVWMDNPRGGLGRVGYRDGTVLTLPGGFLLAQSPTPLQVLDYDNYGGWPVAYAADGLYFAEWDFDGGLLNKTDAGVPSLPMSWRRQTLPDGGEPWLTATDAGPQARPAKLQVVASTEFEFLDGTPAPLGYLPDAGEQLLSQETFQLFIYLDDAVYEVGEMFRLNSHQVQPN